MTMTVPDSAAVAPTWRGDRPLRLVLDVALERQLEPGAGYGGPSARAAVGDRVAVRADLEARRAVVAGELLLVS